MAENRDKLIAIFQNRQQNGGDTFDLFLAVCKFMSDQDCLDVMRLNELQNELREEEDEDEDEDEDDED